VKSDNRASTANLAMGTIVQDAAYSHRFLRSRPGLTFAAALTLALGIGATTVVFSALHALLLRPLPLHEPDRLVVVHEWDPARGVSYSACSGRMFLALRERNAVFTGLTAWYGREANVGGLAEPSRSPRGRPRRSSFRSSD